MTTKPFCSSAHEPEPLVRAVWPSVTVRFPPDADCQVRQAIKAIAIIMVR